MIMALIVLAAIGLPVFTSLLPEVHAGSFEFNASQTITEQLSDVSAGFYDVSLSEKTFFLEGVLDLGELEPAEARDKARFVCEDGGLCGPGKALQASARTVAVKTKVKAVVVTCRSGDGYLVVIDGNQAKADEKCRTP